jgi:SAM-dependent methyltransferase
MQEKPIIFKRLGRRILCTFFPFLFLRKGKVSNREYWESHPTSAFDGIHHASQAMLDEIITLAPDRNTSILDMGCNVGRHLNFLFEQGYRNLRGIDFSSAAIRDMEVRYPEMFASSAIAAISFQDYLRNNPEPADIIYSRGATYELVHPGFPLIKMVCKTAKKHVVLVISETGHSYPRFWQYEFACNGFELTHLRRPASSLAPEHKVSLMVFSRLK